MKHFKSFSFSQENQSEIMTGCISDGCLLEGPCVVIDVCVQRDNESYTMCYLSDTCRKDYSYGDCITDSCDYDASYGRCMEDTCIKDYSTSNCGYKRDMCGVDYSSGYGCTPSDDCVKDYSTGLCHLKDSCVIDYSYGTCFEDECVIDYD